MFAMTYFHVKLIKDNKLTSAQDRMGLKFGKG